MRSGILSRALNHPHPLLRRGLSRNKAGEANNRWRGTRHPNPDPHRSAGSGRALRSSSILAEGKIRAGILRFALE
jgi:hypothetical protein